MKTVINNKDMMTIVTIVSVSETTMSMTTIISNKEMMEMILRARQ